MINMMDDNSEIITYNAGHMPIKSIISTIDDYPALSVTNHWHTDFEFSYVLKGQMKYCVNGEICEVHQGEMIFVNSTQMHYGFWEERCECDFICSVIHPSLLNNEIVGKYISCILSKNAPHYMVLSVDDYNEATVIKQIYEINSMVMEKPLGYEINVMNRIYKLLYHLWQIISPAENENTVKDVKKLNAMHKMVGFIQKNYNMKLSLNDISESGFVCRSSCCEIFSYYLKKSPTQYLNEYRISKSMELLSDLSLGVTDIAVSCGFGSSSYFTETFRKQLGFTPSEYRTRLKNRK